MSSEPFFRPVIQTLFVLLFSFLSLASSDELQALLTLKSSLKDPSNTLVFDSWNANNSTCNFSGITCDLTTNLVTEIELSNHNLSGSVPFDAICGLQSLEKLSLGFNFLSGQVIEDLNKCVSLKYLDLGNNLFSGPVPDISSLSQLMYLYMNMSGFSGTFPWKSLDNMSNLVELSLGDNPFDRTPFPNGVLKLTKLTVLYLSNCSIEGTIPPGIGNLTELTDLELAQNFLTGKIPVEITKLQKLWQLELYMNELTGELPVGFGNLTNLQRFDASTNFLTGNLSEVRLLSKLTSLQLFENEFTGELPPELGDFQHLVNFSVYRNKLSGQIPQNIGSSSQFNFIDASENFFTGSIPPDMCKQGTMTELLILQNNLTGKIPESYANCLTLTRFRVSNNSLSGEVPRGIWGLPNLGMIDVAMNDLVGPVTSDIGKATSLAQLLLSDNKFSGELPSEISKANQLVSLDLSGNQFSGEIPSTIGDLKQLDNLYLQDNTFSGSIPDSLASCDSLTIINLAHNHLSGQIPVNLGSLSTLNSLNLSDNQLSGQIPWSLSSLKLNVLDLSNNKLSGLIPETLSIDAYNGSFSGNNGLCGNNLNNFPKCSAGSGDSKELRKLLICFLGLGIVAMLVCLACFWHLKKKSLKGQNRSWRENSWDMKSFHLLSFTEDDILDGINQDNLIGKGGSGNVYKISLENGNDLAVKHIWNSDPDSKKKEESTTTMLPKGSRKLSEFEAEVQTLSSIRHVNVVKLYCCITSEDSSLLVYEYMPNGSLWDRLHTSNKLVLDWETRYEIALGAAKGLEYLHHGCDRPVIHRDVKSSNILLDELMKPRIADFGLAKIVQCNASKDSTHVIAGTHGYIAPEYGYTQKVDEKSDVYSFGVVLMELITGKRPIEPEFGENKDIVSWISCKLKSKETVLSIIDSAILEGYKEEAIKVLKIAILCTARQPTQRPTMRTVVQMLEAAEPCKLVGIIINKEDSYMKKDLKGNDKLQK
ncbi:OLC1v1017106C1 [Oldenlandia corymbosa var. corymbosa]|uniref:non-specific serine/threonine protein kinase n=1 Tax=Oldenlandia corymbosa var. corymbosa TaxID=529605 RepID=A0AAV1E8Q7_OLDCO|nr:OLC1v1017106C1 [Oldenlandia corymbosa var. corymbosa]